MCRRLKRVSDNHPGWRCFLEALGASVEVAALNEEEEDDQATNHQEEPQLSCSECKRIYCALHLAPDGEQPLDVMKTIMQGGASSSASVFYNVMSRRAVRAPRRGRDEAGVSQGAQDMCRGRSGGCSSCGFSQQRSTLVTDKRHSLTI